ncbi:MAG: hypothetical protein ACRCVS_03765 [Fusobacteriaceae bacterium]
MEEKKIVKEKKSSLEMIQELEKKKNDIAKAISNLKKKENEKKVKKLVDTIYKNIAFLTDEHIQKMINSVNSLKEKK